ncbi:MAG: flavin-containing monooxygenase [Gemmatimonadaceae bacterium]
MSDSIGTTKDSLARVQVAIVGSGFAGLGMAIHLRRAGMNDFVILERAADVGGTWRDNSYPGCACDVESHLYSFSFALNPDWTRRFAPQPEIQAYLQRCAERFGIIPHIRFGHEVLGARWDATANEWVVETSRATVRAAVLVLGNGPLSDPIIPDLPGLTNFEGAVFHSAAWRHDIDLTGLDVAVIGTGASAIQFVPKIQPNVRQLHIFQRTPPWVLPRHDRAIPPARRRLYKMLPPVQRLVRARIYAQRELFLLLFRHPPWMKRGEALARRRLRKWIADPARREKLTPDYTMGCKRVLLSDDYLPALAEPNVNVVTAAVREVRAHGVVDADGIEHRADVIIFGTGFRPTDPPLAPCICGREGKTLADVWQGSPRAYLGTAVAGFPNLFTLLGPNTGLGHTSVVFMIEAQIAQVMLALREIHRRNVRALEPSAEAERGFVADVERRMRNTVWVAGHCMSWYLDRTGRNSSLWPDFTWRFRRRLKRFVHRDWISIITRADAG